MLKSLKNKIFENRERIFELAVILILGLVPLLWFKQNCLIGGVDFDLPLDPIRRFIERKFTWSNMFLGGMDRANDIPGGFAFIGVQAFFRILGLSLFAVQKIFFVFWFTITGLSMYFFVSLLVSSKDKKSSIIRIASSIFYMFNFYQLHMWMIARVGEISGAILIPASLALLIKGLEKKISFWKAAFIGSIFFIIASGIGVQPPVLGVFFFSIFFYLFFHFCCLSFCAIKRDFLSNIHFFVGFLLIFFLINMFWVLPVANYIIQSGYTSTAKSFEVFNLLGLLESTSRYNNFLNVFRFFGDNIWFDGFKNVPYMPFFPAYQTNQILILLSFIFPILAFSALLFSRNRYVLFFSLLGIIAVFLGKGIHPPFGNVFLWIFKHIPGFWVYRAPWQKFGLLMMLSYSFLAGITCGCIYEYLQKFKFEIKNLFLLKKLLPLLFVVTILLLHLGYHYGFILGKMLPTTDERKVLPGFHQKYPKYLFDSSRWINSMDDEFNIVLLPDDKANAYEWGYGGASDITIKLFNKGLIFRQYGEGMAPPQSLDKVYQAFISSLYNKEIPYVARILGLLNVRYLLQRNDFLYDWAGDRDSPEFVKERILNQEDIKLEKSFGKWDFYRNSYKLPHIYASTDLIYVNADINAMPDLVSSDNFNLRAAYLFAENMTDSNHFISKIITEEISIPESRIRIFLRDGWKKPVSWDIMPSGPSFECRVYKGSKSLISINGKGTRDMLIFGSTEECPYRLPSGGAGGHGAYNSTLIYIKTGTSSLRIDNIYADGKPVVDIIDIWWESGHAKQRTNSILYPVRIPANEKAIIQVNHLVKNEVVLTRTSDKLYHLRKNSVSNLKKKNNVIVKFQRINPTKYLVKVENADVPFCLMFLESFHKQWRLYLADSDGKEKVGVKENGAKHLMKFTPKDIKYLFKKPLEASHLLVNGYANGWYVESEKLGLGEDFTLVMYFWPQSLFYLGLLISGLTFICCVIAGFKKKALRQKNKLKERIN